MEMMLLHAVGALVFVLQALFLGPTIWSQFSGVLFALFTNGGLLSAAVHGHRSVGVALVFLMAGWCMLTAILWWANEQDAQRM